MKLRISEKDTKFEKNLPHGFDKSANLLEEDVFKLCLLLRKSELYWVCVTIYSEQEESKIFER